MGEEPQAIRDQIAATRDQMGETADAIAYRTNVKARAKDGITSKVAGVRDSLGLGVSHLRDTAPTAGDVRQGAAHAAGVAQENPIGLAIGSAAIGFLVGLVVPVSRVESDRLGPIADEIKEQAVETGHEAVEHAREIVEDVVAGAAAAAQESTQEHADELKASAEESVEHVKEAASQQ